jgi:imidazoleglycerol-phosphate dehydratase
MAAPGRSGIRVELRGSGAASVETGLPVIDRLLERLAEYARFDLALEVGYGFASMTSSEALASVVLEVSDESLVVSNVDLTQARIGGLGTDVARRFLERFAEGAGVTLHVRLLNGTETQHVLEAIFKALGVALAQACGTEGGESGR